MQNEVDRECWIHRFYTFFKKVRHFSPQNLTSVRFFGKRDTSFFLEQRMTFHVKSWKYFDELECTVDPASLPRHPLLLQSDGSCNQSCF